MRHERPNIFDAALLFAATIATVVFVGTMPGCGYPAETKITPAESSVTNRVTERYTRVGPQNALCQTTVVKPAPSVSPRKEYVVQWIESPTKK